MNQRGYVGLIVLLIGTGLALYLFMQYSPLGHGASDAGLMKNLDDAKTKAALIAASSSRDQVTEEDLR